MCKYQSCAVVYVDMYVCMWIFKECCQIVCAANFSLPSADFPTRLSTYSFFYRTICADFSFYAIYSLCTCLFLYASVLLQVSCISAYILEYAIRFLHFQTRVFKLNNLFVDLLKFCFITSLQASVRVSFKIK